MTTSRKHKLLAAWILVCICIPALGQEPNEAETRLKFEVSSERQSWFIKMPAGEPPTTGSGPIKPTHMAEFFIWNIPYQTRQHAGRPATHSLRMDFRSDEVIRKLIGTSAGQSMSQKQRDLLRTGDAIITVGNFSDTVGNHWHFRLYAVSEGDAKKMAQALLEFPTDKANERLQWHTNRQQKFQGHVDQCRKEISEKQVKLKTAQTKLEELQKTVHYVSTIEAEGTVVELNKTLDDLNIEIAGLRAKVQATFEKEIPRRTSTSSEKLIEIRIEQMIELKAAEARKETATEIRNQAEAFYRLVNQLIQLPKELKPLKSSLSSNEAELRNIEHKLANPDMDMVPPKVFQNKVTIYPVHQ
jgi:hypothetical protein